MQKLLFFSLIAIYSCSSPGQASLVGEWKPVKATIHNSSNKISSVYYDKNNQDSVKEKLSRQYVLESAADTEDVEKADTSGFKHMLDSVFLKFDSASLIFKSDSTVLINSYGLLMPPAIPGWHFGDKVIGKWMQQKDNLKFIIGDNKINYPLFYKIIKQTSDSLILAMTDQDYKDTTMILDFVRQ